MVRTQHAGDPHTAARAHDIPACAESAAAKTAAVYPQKVRTYLSQVGNRLCAWTVRAFVAVSIGTDHRRWRDTCPGCSDRKSGRYAGVVGTCDPAQASSVGRAWTVKPTGEEVKHLGGGAG